jgi:predicted O-linked N-acetylglucosamine transferase (SPINDLY family)
MNSNENNQSIALAEYYFRNNNYPFAAAILKKIIEVDFSNSKANELLAYVESNQGNHELAHQLLMRACQDKQASANALYYLGSSFLKKNQFQEAKDCFTKALDKAGDFFEGLHDLATACASLGENEDALFWYQKALTLKNDSYEVFYNLGKIFDALKHHDNALNAYEHAIKLKPDFAEAWFNKGCALNDLKRYPEAIEAFRKAIDIQPETIANWDYGGMLFALTTTCSWADFSTNEDVINGLLNHTKGFNPFFSLAFVDDPDLHKKEALSFVQDKFHQKDDFGKIPRQSKKDKIRIGYFSADFHNHATAYLIAEMLELHDRERFEIHALSFGPNACDAMRQRCVNAVDHFHDVTKLSDQAIAKLARDLEIDIAIDLKGHTQDGRMGIFALRAAPIQISYLGYPGTSGADYMDYLVADPILIPDASQIFYTEKVIFLPNSYQANDSKRETSKKLFSKSELGLPEKGFIFCCFNASYKISPSTFDGWCRILKKVEASVLWLFEGNPKAKENLIKEANRRGIDSNRLIFSGRIENSEHLARQCLADLFLDTLPYNAHTTSSDALWAGLPVLTLAGQSFASRVSASLLTAIGLPELITQTQGEYESLAIELATNSKKLSAIKNQLKSNLLTEPLFNAQLFTRHLEAAYAEVYQRYQDNLSPDHIYVKPY